MSAMIGSGEPFLISIIACAASLVGTATRTILQFASLRRAILPDVPGVRLGHGLHHDFGGAPDHHVTDANRNRLAARSHGFISAHRYMSQARSKQTKEPHPRSARPAPERGRPACPESAPAPKRRPDRHPTPGTAGCWPGRG